jgi:hypothetical protein
MLFETITETLIIVVGPLLFETITETLIIVVGPHILRRSQPAAQWYAEQWGGLVAEARASVTRQPEVTAVDVCSGLATAQIVSDLPGRVRLRVPHLRGCSGLAKEVEVHLSRQPGVQRVTASAATGSVLIYYNQREFGLDRIGQLRQRGDLVSHEQCGKPYPTAPVRRVVFA